MQYIDLYTRPGCPYSYMLRWRLRTQRIAYREIDIRRDADAAARVRAVADGNETVPTVFVGGRWMVNPTIEEVVAAMPSALT